MTKPQELFPRRQEAGGNWVKPKVNHLIITKIASKVLKLGSFLRSIPHTINFFACLPPCGFNRSTRYLSKQHVDFIQQDKLDEIVGLALCGPPQLAAYRC